MSAKLLFIHGTGTRETSGSMQQITERAQQLLGFSSDRVFSLEWGKAVGPEDLDIRTALPPEYSTRGIGEGISEAEEQAALWDLLLADPLVELRLLAVAASQDDSFVFNEDLPSVEVQRRLDRLTLPEDSLAQADLSAGEIKTAVTTLRDSQELTDAADRVGDADDAELIVATARSVCALALARRLPTLAASREQPRASYDGSVREMFVGDIAESLSVGTRGLGGDLLKKIITPIATKVAVAKRSDFMGPLSDFLRDIAFYIAHGREVREWLATEIRKHADGSPVVVLAHSLGGIAAVDLLSDPDVMGTPEQPRGDRPKVDLLVTVGSQSPLLFLMDSLQSLRPNPPQGAPFVPWLNIYNREDLLSFCAARVWAGQSQIFDAPVSAGVPFPASHNAYWVTDDVYTHIKERMP